MTRAILPPDPLPRGAEAVGMAILAALLIVILAFGMAASRGC